MATPVIDMWAPVLRPGDHGPHRGELPRSDARLGSCCRDRRRSWSRSFAPCPSGRRWWSGGSEGTRRSCWGRP